MSLYITQKCHSNCLQEIRQPTCIISDFIFREWIWGANASSLLYFCYRAAVVAVMPGWMIIYLLHAYLLSLAIVLQNNWRASYQEDLKDSMQNIKESLILEKKDVSFIFAFSSYLRTKRSASFRWKLHAQYHDFMNPTQLLVATLSLCILPLALILLPH